MRRGDLVTIALPGDFAKPCPAVIIQSDLFAETGIVAVLLVSPTLVDAPLLRITVEPSPVNGLHKVSQIMIDKPMAVKRDKLGANFGRLEDDIMLAVNRSLAVFLNIV